MKSMRILYAVNGYKPAYRIGGSVVSVYGMRKTWLNEVIK